MLAWPVTEIRFWEDPPYMMGGVEIPSRSWGMSHTNPDGNPSLPADVEYETDLGVPDWTMITVDVIDETEYPLRPDRWNAEHEIKVSQVIDRPYRYMRMTRRILDRDSQESTEYIYCWITDIIEQSSAAESYLIRFTIDYWRTYNQRATFGRGNVERCPLPEFRRPYNVQPRHRRITDIIPLNPTQDTVSDGSDIAASWIIVVYTENVGTESAPITVLHKAFFPISDEYLMSGASFTKAELVNMQWQYSTVTAPSAASVYEGRFDESMGIDPAAVVGVYLSPICPSDGFTSWSDSRDSWVGLGNVKTHGSVSWMEEANSFSKTWEYDLGQEGITAGDETSYIITGMQGEIMGALPYGVTVTKARIAVDCGASGAYLHVSFVSGLSPEGTDEQLYNDYYNAGPKFAATVGLAYSIPLPAVPVTENAWSSYVYSGQRDFDVESAKIAREQNLINGLTGILTGGATGGLTGAMLKSTPMTAAGGALIGAAAGAGMAGLRYGMEGYFNDRLQDAKDQLYANQTGNLILSGGSRYYLVHSELTGQKNLHGVCVVALTMDAVSQAEYESDMELNGYPVQFTAPSCTALIDAGGPLRISDLKVGGAGVTFNAIESIKDMFTRGVYIVMPPAEEEEEEP